MSRLANALVFILLTVTISCSPSGSRYGEIQYASELIVERMDNNLFPLEAVSVEESRVCYNFLVKGCLCTSSPIFVCSKPQGWTVSVNGTEVPLVEGMHQTDDSDGCFVIAGLVKDGRNTIELTGSGEVSASYVAGEFDVLRTDQPEGWILDYAGVPEIGSLASQGLPFYTGEVSYRRKFVVPEKVGRRILELSDWKGSSCEVWINGSKYASVTSTNYKKNIGRNLTPGVNEIEVRLTGPGDEFGLFKEFTLK